MALLALAAGLLAPIDTLTAQPADDGGDEPEAEGLLDRYYREHEVYLGRDFTDALARARAAFAKGNFALAAEQFDQAAGLSPKHPVVPFLVGHTAIAQDRTDDAYDEITHGLTLLPEWVGADFSLLHEYGATEDSAAAVRLEQHLGRLATAAATALASRDQSRFARLQFLYGYMLWHSADLGDAEAGAAELVFARQAFEEVVKLAPDDRYVALYLQQADRWGIRAADAPQQPLFLIPERDDWLREGLALLHEGDSAAAAVHFGREALVNTFSVERYRMFAWMSIALLADRRFEESARMLRRAIKSGSTGVLEIVDMPPLTDLLGEDAASATAQGLKPGLRSPAWQIVLTAFIELLAGDREAAELRLGAVKPTDAEWKATANALRDALVQRIRIPRIEDWEALLAPPTDAGTDPPLDPNGNGHIPETQPDLNARIREVNQRFDEARVAFTKGEYGGALKQWADAAEQATAITPHFFLDPNHALHVHLLAKVQFALGEWKRCRDALVKYLNAVPENLRKQGGLFQIGFPDPTDGVGNGEFERAYAACRDRVTSTPTDLDAQFVYGYVSYTLAEYRDAFNALHEVVKADPADLIAAEYLRELGAPPHNLKAEPPTERAPRLLKDARAALEADDITGALQLYRGSYDLDKTDLALTGIIICAWLQADYTSAHLALKAHLLDLERTTPRGDPWRDYWLDFETGMPEHTPYADAIKQLRDHLRARQGDHHANYLAAFAYYFEGSFTQATTHFNVYKEWAPRDDRTKEVDYFLAACSD